MREIHEHVAIVHKSRDLRERRAWTCACVACVHVRAAWAAAGVDRTCRCSFCSTVYHVGDPEMGEQTGACRFCLAIAERVRATGGKAATIAAECRRDADSYVGGLQRDALARAAENARSAA